MTELGDLKIWTQTNGKVWAAATGRSPYFCFVAATREEALAEARRALTFYWAARAKRDEVSEARDAEAREFEFGEPVQAKDLVDA